MQSILKQLCRPFAINLLSGKQYALAVHSSAHRRHQGRKKQLCESQGRADDTGLLADQAGNLKCDDLLRASTGWAPGSKS